MEIAARGSGDKGCVPVSVDMWSYLTPEGSWPWFHWSYPAGESNGASCAKMSS